MKVLGIVGSPRKKGNTDILVQQVLDGAAEAGAETEKIYINDMEFKGCQGCGFCKIQDYCKLEDDMTPVYDKIKETDGLVFGSPIYFAQFTGQMRLFLDRCYALSDADVVPRVEAGKKAVLVGSQGFDDDTAYKGVFDEFADQLKTYVGIEVTDILIGADVNLSGDVRKNHELMDQAKNAGLEMAK